MAKKAKRAAQPAMAMAPEPDQKRISSTRMVLMLSMISLIPFSIPTMLLMGAGMLPTLVAALTDRSPARYAWICVGGLNFAGLAPAMLKLWFGHHEITYAIHQVTDFRTLLLAYLAAGAGWMLYFGAPPVVMGIMMATTKRRAAALAVQMKKLEEEWGSEVATRQAADGAADDDL
jgi:hypothetical protein